jgi:hypothetical protein
MLEEEVGRVSSDWIVVVVITGLLVMMTAYFGAPRLQEPKGREGGWP